MTEQMPVIVYHCTDSTNTRAKEYVKTHDCDRALFVANKQTAGRGRQGKSFYSPDGTGVYMSYIFKINKSLANAVSVTTAASVAITRTLEALCNKHIMIKWVNDLYLDGKKICGILTEAVTTDGDLTHIVIGVGINLTTKDFPDDIRDIAGCLDTDIPRERIIAAVTDALATLNLADKSYLDFYRQRMMVLNKPIIYYENGVPTDAVAIDIDQNGGLIIRTPDGKTHTLRSGEISVKIK